MMEELKVSRIKTTESGRTTIRGSEGRRPTPPLPREGHPEFVSAFIKPIHEKFFHDVVNLLIEKSLHFERSQVPFEFKHPESLVSLVDVSLGDQGVSHAQLLTILKSVIRYSPHYSHPYNLDKTSTGLDPYAVAGDWLASTMTTPLALYLISPVFTLMEIEIVKTLCNLVGFHQIQSSGRETRSTAPVGGGITTPGPGIANIMAISCALNAKYADFKQLGFSCIRPKVPIIFASEHCSPSFEKALIYQGFPTNSLVRVKVDENGRMRVDSLKQEINKHKEDPNNVALVIVGTAGTSFLGAIDPLSDIGKLCSEESIWFHVDAEIGGGALLDSSQNYRFKGIQLANSMTFGTSLLGLPSTTSFLLTKDPEALQKTFSYQATYLYTGNDIYDSSFDRGDCTLQTSRRPDVLKFWYFWKGRGKIGISTQIKKCYKNAEAFITLLKSRPGFLLLSSCLDTPQVCFQYIPDGLRKISNSSQFEHRLSKFTDRLRASLIYSGVMHISESNFPKSQSKYFILSFCNSNLILEDLQYIVSQIESFGQRLQIPFLNHDQVPLNIANPDWILPSLIETPKGNYEKFGHKNNVENSTADLYGKMFKGLVELFLKRSIFYEERRHEPPLVFRKPEELYKLYDFKLGDHPMSHKDILEDMEIVMRYSLHPGHLYFMYQLLSGQDPYTLLADFFVTTLNTPAMTYEDSPVFTLMENELMRQLRNVVFQTTTGDGIVTDGGSMSNQIAVSLALRKKFPEVSKLGISKLDRKLRIFVSEDGHFSFSKGAVLKGLGSQSCVYIKTDQLGRMITAELVTAIEQSLSDGCVPFMVVATTGTTIYGSIDPLPKIVEICTKYNLWCHVDACFGGFLLMSHLHRTSLHGIHKTDSVAMNAHKMMASTLTTSVLISKHQNIFRETFTIPEESQGHTTTILYDKKKWDNAEKHIQTSKRNNVFKLWFLWKAKGRSGLENHVNKIMENAKYATNSIRNREGFRLLLEKFELTNVCFYYIPESLRTLDFESAEFRQRFAKVSFGIEKLLVKNEVMSIVTQRRATGISHVFFKLVLMNSALTIEDIDYLLDQIEYYGQIYDKEN